MTSMPMPMEKGPLHTQESLTDAFAACGVQSGQTLIVHSSLKKIGGSICGGPEAVVNALLAVLGDEGTLVMPTHTSAKYARFYFKPSVNRRKPPRQSIGNHSSSRRIASFTRSIRWHL